MSSILIEQLIISNLGDLNLDFGVVKFISKAREKVAHLSAIDGYNIYPIFLDRGIWRVQFFHKGIHDGKVFPLSRPADGGKGLTTF